MDAITVPTLFQDLYSRAAAPNCSPEIQRLVAVLEATREAIASGAATSASAARSAAAAARVRKSRATRIKSCLSANGLAR